MQNIIDRAATKRPGRSASCKQLAKARPEGSDDVDGDETGPFRAAADGCYHW